MTLSVVVPTLNDRERLVSCLDALSAHAPGVEVIVVNGPSADGTTGMVRDRDDVDTLVQVAERNVNVARNAGLETADGETVALIDDEVRVQSGWLDALREAIGAGADVVTGPARRTLRGGATAEQPEHVTVAGHDVPYFSGNNVAFSRTMIDALDGFDEYLRIGGTRDAAHRIARLGGEVVWRPELCVHTREGDSDRVDPDDWGLTYRSLAYRMAKNYGPHPSVIRRTVRSALSDARSTARELFSGDRTPTEWVADGRAVIGNTLVGTKDGLIARFRDRTSRRNPYGISARDDRIVEQYDWR